MKVEQKFSAAGTGSSELAPRGVVTHQVILTGTGAISATVIHEGTNDEAGLAGWTTIATYTLSGTTEVADSNVLQHSWLRIRARCTAIAGTSAVARSIVVGAGA